MLWLYFGLLLVATLCLVVVTIWGAARLVRVPGVTWRRAALATLGCWLVGLIFVGGTAAASSFIRFDTLQPQQQLLATVVFAVGLLVFQGWVLWKVFSTTKWRAAAVLAIATVLQLALNEGATHLFRDNVSEAFVVPTGSMATAIYGQHANATCPQCGWQFAASMSHVQEDRPTTLKAFARCTNCGAGVELDEKARVSGDRILVDKTAAAKRWDCAIYHEPESGTIYVHRLVGFPGETVGLSQGDLFINNRRLAKLPGQQQSMWREVADSTFVAITPTDDTPGWRPAEQQPEKLAGKLHIDDRSPEALWQYDGEITNEISYNANPAAAWHQSLNDSVLVWDVRVRARVESASDGAVWGAVWDRDVERIECELRAGEVTLIHRVTDVAADQPPSRATEKFTQPSAPFSIAFSRRDGWAYVEINDQVVAKLPVAADAWNEAEKEKLTQPRLELFAQAGEVQLGRVQLATDVHYLAAEELFVGGSSRNPITLADGEYFFLGDNSQRAKDCRYTGPAAKPLGVARWGYWPPERWRRLD